MRNESRGMQLVQPFVTIAASALLLGEIIEPGTLFLAFVMISPVTLGRRMPVGSVSPDLINNPAFFRAGGLIMHEQPDCLSRVETQDTSEMSRGISFSKSHQCTATPNVQLL